MDVKTLAIGISTLAFAILSPRACPADAPPEVPAINAVWMEKSRVPERRIFEIAANIRGKIYAVTSGEDGKPGTEVFEYTPESNSWRKRNSRANVVRHSFGAATLDGKIYVWGGLGADSRMSYLY